MLSASRLRAPSRHVCRRFLHSTSQLKDQPDNAVENVSAEVQVTVYQQDGFKRHYVTNPSLRAFLEREELVRIHQERRRYMEYAHLNAFITEPLDEAILEERAWLKTKIIPHGSTFLKPNQRLIAVKDNISSSKFFTTCASQMLDGYKSPYNAVVVEGLERHGATVTGKTNMDEFGMGSHSINSKYGAVRRQRPWRPYTAGGSSGGSAVAVATRVCGLALGTDTGGSVRLPAAYNGTVGFKPSYGRLSRWGLVPYANSLDTVGILSLPSGDSLSKTRTLHGNLFRFMRSKEATDPDPSSLTQESRRRLKRMELEYSRQIRRQRGAIASKAEKGTKRFKPGSSNRLSVPIRFGVPMEYNTHELSKDVRLAWQNLLENLQAQGHQIVPISLPSTRHALSAYYIIAAAEAASNLAKYDGIRYGYRSQTSDGAGGVLYANSRGEGFGGEVQRRILLGSYTLSSKAIDNYFLQAQKIRRLVQRDFDRVFALPNGLRPIEPINLSELDENIPLEDKTGPAQVDLIVCPTAPTFAPRTEEVKTQSPAEAYINDVFTVPASLAGLPAISIPVPSADEKGRRAGMQIIGQYFDDNFVVDVAERILYAASKKNFNSLKTPIHNG